MSKDKKEKDKKGEGIAENRGKMGKMDENWRLGWQRVLGMGGGLKMK